MQRRFAKDKRLPWLLLASSLEVREALHLLPSPPPKPKKPTITPRASTTKWGHPLTSFQANNGMDGQEDLFRSESIPSSLIGQLLFRAEKVVAEATDVDENAGGGETTRCLDSIVLRFSQVYGSFLSEDRDLWFPNAIQNAIRKLPVHLPDIDRLDLLHINDAITGIGRAIVALETTPKYVAVPSPCVCVYHTLDLGSAQPITMLDVKRAILEATNSRSVAVFLPFKDTVFHLPNLTKTQREMGYYPQVFWTSITFRYEHG